MSNLYSSDLYYSQQHCLTWAILAVKSACFLSMDHFYIDFFQIFIYQILYAHDGSWPVISLQALHRYSPFERLPFINVQFSCGTGHPNHVVALLSPGWMPSNPTESFLGAPLCLVMTVRWLLAAVLMQMHIWVCSHDIFPILWSKTCL